MPPIPSSPPSELGPRATTVHRLASSLGFALVGIASAEPTEHEEELSLWLAAGKHGDMAYLKTSFATRIDPQQLQPGAKSIICVADWYGGGAEDQGPGAEGQAEPGKGQIDSNAHGPIRPDSASTAQLKSDIANQQSSIINQQSPFAQGRIARYAWGDDYHRIMKPRLHDLADAMRGKWPQHEFRSAVDTAPLLEREHASRAGLGWVGKHTLLIHPQLGSWLLLGAILTTLPIETSAYANYPAPLTPPTDHCGTCTRCIDACPTQCITPYSVDGSRCISYLTIEHRGLIDPSLHPTMRDWIAGCDVCQEVCPFNQESGDRGQESGVRGQESGVRGQESGVRSQESVSGRPVGAPANVAMRPQYQPRPPAPTIALLDVLNWTEADRQAALVRSPLKRIKLDMFKRNALIAAGNALAAGEDESLRRKVEETAENAAELPLVRETARQVMRRLTAPR